MPELGKYLRLKSAISSSIAEAGDSATAAKSLGDAYGRFRAEAHSIAAETQTVDEFDRLFPVLPNSGRATARMGFDPIEASSAAHEARVLLAALAGWLNGFVIEQQNGLTQ